MSSGLVLVLLVIVVDDQLHRLAFDDLFLFRFRFRHIPLSPLALHALSVASIMSRVILALLHLH